MSMRLHAIRPPQLPLPPGRVVLRHDDARDIRGYLSSLAQTYSTNPNALEKAQTGSPVRSEEKGGTVNKIHNQIYAYAALSLFLSCAG